MINSFPGYEFTNGENMYRGDNLGKGGYVYGNPGIYENVAMLDIQSMHPNSAIAMNYFGEYTPFFQDLVNARVAIKNGDFDSAKHMMGGKLSEFLNNPDIAGDLAQALKIAINSVYGLTSAKFENPFRDSRNQNNIVALRGALFMRTLQDEVTDRGYTVVGIRTDSIKIANANREIVDFCIDFATQYGYAFDFETVYDRIALVNNAVYIAKYMAPNLCEDIYTYIPKENKKHGGEWTATGAQFAEPYVFKKLFSHEAIDFDDVCAVKEVKSVDGMFLDMNEGLDPDEHNYQFIGRVGLFCPIKAGYGGGELMVKRDDKYSAVTGTKGYRWLEAEQVKMLSMEDAIDVGYFNRLVDEAVDTISQYGDFEAFVGDHEYVPVSQVA